MPALDDLDVILGGEYVAVGGIGGKIWRKLKSALKALYKNKYVRAIEIATVGTVATMFGGPIAGAAAVAATKKGLDLIKKAAEGNKKAVAQVKEVSDKAKAGNKKYQDAYEMLQVMNEVRKETKVIPAAAVASGTQLVAAAAAGSPAALKQVKAIADGAAAGDQRMAATREMLAMIHLSNKVAAAQETKAAEAEQPAEE